MRIGISSLIFTKMKNGVDIYTFFPEIKKAGFDCIEYSDTNSPSLDEIDQNKLNNVRKTAQDYGIEIISVHIPPCQYLNEDIGAIDHNIRKNAVNNVKINLTNANILGAEYVILHPGGVGENLENTKILTMVKECFNDSLLELAEAARDLQIQILIENTMGIWGGDIEEIKRIIKTTGNNCGFCLDVGHCWLEDRDPVKIISESSAILKYLHIHDNNTDKDAHLVPGEGTIPWAAVLKALDDINYSGIFMFECVFSQRCSNFEAILDHVNSFRKNHVESIAFNKHQSA
ncbi:MAG: sugar phosphate isomerase/epimerase [Verrucomicrobia bacterium]|nr:sugar phosphate isomerase/epimerase [Verrucomicrobiota bacterium]MBU1735024.1 sugar phosphate isomerase/epimerase [Verrucomicrobiota bacterium]MBU1856038.1 sugar phosphate isomerase/epimerase [Verrucomicrobiota bacterium]